ncbi:unnamed protein product [Linum tenue]|uniref:CCHC-type domain-containing protein n=1 Tax=Linum tenue TaxID=586396 RepID=A0AAV0H8V9_9ROSI|nr:unnamed protein product [Linum tenue]
MIVWVQFPGLPVHFYHKELLFTMGNLIGRSIKLDYHTQHQQRAKFARMAVEVDLSKPLVPRIRLDGRWQQIEYENLPVVCFECGRVGHTNVSCQSREQGGRGESVQGALAPAAIVADGSSPEANAGFGPWMVVTRKSRRNLKDTATNGKAAQVLAITNGQKKDEGRKESGTSGMAQPQSIGNSLQKQRQQTGESQAAKTEGKGKGKSKGKGKAMEAVGSAEKGLLGPKPTSGEASSSGTSNGLKTAARAFESQSERSQQAVKSACGLTEMETGLAPSSGPTTQTINGENGTKIRIVETQAYQPPAPRVADPDVPSAVSRTNSKKEGRGSGTKRTATPKKGTAMRHNPLKPLQIWSPVKEKKGRNKEKRVSLTLQQIKDWTDAAKPKTVAEPETMNREAAEEMVAISSGPVSNPNVPAL